LKLLWWAVMAFKKGHVNEPTVVVALYAATKAMRSRTRNANVPFMMLLESDYEDIFFD
jgi:hypothetical protein